MPNWEQVGLPPIGAHRSSGRDFYRVQEEVKNLLIPIAYSLVGCCDWLFLGFDFVILRHLQT